MTPSVRRLACLLAPLALLLASTRLLAGPGGAPAGHDRWYVMQMQGQRAGYMHDFAKRDGDRITSSTDMALSIKRGEITIDISISSEFVETMDGKPVSMKSTQKLGALPETKEYQFTDKDIAVTITQGGSTTSSTRPLPDGVWLTPHAAGEFVEKRLAAGAKEIVVRTIDASIGLSPIVMTHRVLERTSTEALGKTVPAVKWSSTTDQYPDLESIEYVDDRGVAIRSETDLGGIRLVMLLADKDLALAQADPPELMKSTFVTPSRPIADARDTTSAVYVLSVEKGRMADLPSTASQKADRIDERSFRITVDTKHPAAAAPADLDNAEFTKPNGMINSDDPEVKKLADQALADAGKKNAGRLARAKALREFVYKHIDKKELGVGFASAAEVARTGCGDCSEHGVLLAALLRAEGIPSRVVSGLIYADGFFGQKSIFGYHMWTQALLDADGEKRWIDLDAVLPPRMAFDATHIALAVSALNEDETTNSLVALVPLIGTLQIKVEKTE